MRRFAASLLAFGVAAGIGTASAQSEGYRANDGDGQPIVDRQGPEGDAYYDYARVLRVEPVPGQRPAEGRQDCAAPADDSRDYAGNDGDVVHDRDGDRYEGDDRYSGDDGGDRGSDDGDSGDARVYSSDDDRSPRDDGGGDDRDDGDGDDRADGRDANDRGTTVGANVATVVGGVVGAAVGSQVGGGSARYATTALGTMVGSMAGRQVYENTHRPSRMAPVQVCDDVPTGNDGAYRDGRNAHADAYDVTYEYAGRTYTTPTRYNPGDRIRVRVDVSAE